MTIQLDGAIATKTTASPYALTAPALIANGYSAIPIMPGEKRPGLAPDKGLVGWQRFCDRLPTKIETDLWRDRPDLGVGVALGAASGSLVAVDVDSEDPAVIKAVEAVTGVSPVRKRGRKGQTAFFCANLDAVKSRPFKFANGDGVDLLAHGRQTVLPPTLHPEGAPYVWLGVDTLEHVSPEHLPELPDDIADQLADVLAPFGYVAEPEPKATTHSGGGDGSIWKETNEIALAALSAWVPALGIGAKRKGAGWRAPAGWRGGENDNVSFHPKGIRDFVTGEGLSAIDIVMKVQGCANGEALTWLRNKLGLRDPEPIEFKLKMRDDAAELASDGDTGPPGVDDQLMRMARAYAKARIANNNEHPVLTDDLRQVYRESLLEIMVLDVLRARAGAQGRQEGRQQPSAR